MDKYKSLAVWQHAHGLCMEVLATTDQEYRPQARALFEQLRRAAISVEANIVEGYALSTPAQFRRHLRISLGSAAEVECLVNIGSEAGYLRTEHSERLRQHVDRTIGTLYGLLRSTRR
jgi:four helix bundle protein